jgi:hypothetical protein
MKNHRAYWWNAALGGLATAAFAASAGAQATPPASRDSVVSIYCAAWGAPRPSRDAMLARVWASDGTYSDPTPTFAAGRAALSDSIDAFQRRLPGAQIRCSPVQAHHETMRFTWSLLGADGVERIQGMDFGEFAADGRIRRIVGFFGAPPAVSR